MFNTSLAQCHFTQHCSMFYLEEQQVKVSLGCRPFNPPDGNIRVAIRRLPMEDQRHRRSGGNDVSLPKLLTSCSEVICMCLPHTHFLQIAGLRAYSQMCLFVNAHSK